MCGIVGVVNKKSSVYSKKDAIQMLKELLHFSQTRGSDSSGVAVVLDEQIKVLKAAVSADKLISSKAFETEVWKDSENFAAIGHARMETNGSFAKKENNQPIVTGDVVTIHNGIIVNDSELWSKNPKLKRTSEVDTEVFNAILTEKLTKSSNLIDAVKESASELKGSFSFGILFKNYNILLLLTNKGSLYTALSPNSDTFIFGSEKRIVEKTLNQPIFLGEGDNFKITHVPAGTGMIIDLATLDRFDFKIESERNVLPDFEIKERGVEVEYPQFKSVNIDSRVSNIATSREIEKEVNRTYSEAQVRIKELKRCSKCILPESMPFIKFDDNGVCNYCHNHQPRETRGVVELEKEIAKFRKNDGTPDCIVAFSGGRDSSYALHYAKKELGLTPLAYSYDWGMLTDLGRRNQARMTGQLGVEHILVSADIQKKRSYIRKNVSAWLKKPDIGMIPLFMAGDKQYFYYLNKLRQETQTPLVIYADNALEKTDFKYGFANVQLSSDVGKAYNIGMKNSFSLLWFYFSQYARNPAYWNDSLADTFTAYISSYFVDKTYLYLFRYLLWEENDVSSTLIDQYEWETSPDTKSTWRIGDGTASFYNYIYYVVTGLTENDTFRSNQIREGAITRDEALKLSERDNVPRIDSMIWYCDTIGINCLEALKKINTMKKFY